MNDALIPNLDTGSTPVSSISPKARPVRVFEYLGGRLGEDLTSQHLRGGQLQLGERRRDDRLITPEGCELVGTGDESTDHDPFSLWINQPILRNTAIGVLVSLVPIVADVVLGILITL
jgi:hypothetical protein